MGKHKLKGKDLRKINFPNDKIKSVALNTMAKHFKYSTIDEQLTIITQVLNNPQDFLEDERLTTLVYALTYKPKLKTEYEIHKLKNDGDFTIFGERHIGESAIEQMKTAMRLPIAIKGALMPDAHHGYGLPIGGVLAVENAVIPFGVGLDIGCRMALTLYELPSDYIEKKQHNIEKALHRYTHFGNEGTLDFDVHHDVLDRGEFGMTALLRRLHQKAWYQLGTSGTGNHFVEFGNVTLIEKNKLNVPAGNYIGILSHSGSRGMGAAIAAMFTKTAVQKCKLPNEAKSLAWLNLNEEAGAEYWMSMNLAGDYAKACHDVIHINLQRVLGLTPIAKVENHHNFAWKEIVDGREMIVHRKGATPASENELGIIPGSMASPGYIVSGKGNSLSVNSASHGAGRKFSRNQAREKNTVSEMKQLLRDHQVTLIGGSTEESPLAYKDIETVMKAQCELVNVEGTFIPRIVRMNKR